MGNHSNTKLKAVTDPARDALEAAILERNTAASVASASVSARDRAHSLASEALARVEKAEKGLATLRETRKADAANSVKTGISTLIKSETPLRTEIADAAETLEAAEEALAAAEAEVVLTRYHQDKSELALTDAIAAVVETEVGEAIRAFQAAVDELVAKRNALHFIEDRVLRDQHGMPRSPKQREVERLIHRNPFEQFHRAWTDTPAVEVWKAALTALRSDAHTALPVL